MNLKISKTLFLSLLIMIFSCEKENKSDSNFKFTNLKVGFSPAKLPKVISGAIFGAGKLNGIWKTGVLIKQK